MFTTLLIHVWHISWAFSNRAGLTGFHPLISPQIITSLFSTIIQAWICDKLKTPQGKRNTWKKTLKALSFLKKCSSFDLEPLNHYHPFYKYINQTEIAYENWTSSCLKVPWLWDNQGSWKTWNCNKRNLGHILLARPKSQEHGPIIWKGDQPTSSGKWTRR